MVNTFSHSSPVVTIFVLIVLGIFIFNGAKKGFTRLFINIFGTIISIVLALLLCGVVADFFEESFSLVTSLTSSIESVVTKLLGDTLANTTLTEFNETLLNGNGLASMFLGIILLAQQNTNIPVDVTINQVVSPVIAYYVACIISFIILLIIFKILLFLLCQIITSIRSIKVIGALDSILGAVLGAIEFIVFTQLVLLFTSIIPIEFIQNVNSFLLQCPIILFIDNINLIELIFMGIASPNLENLIKF